MIARPGGDGVINCQCACGTVHADRGKNFCLLIGPGGYALLVFPEHGCDEPSHLLNPDTAIQLMQLRDLRIEVAQVGAPIDDLGELSHAEVDAAADMLEYLSDDELWDNFDDIHNE